MIKFLDLKSINQKYQSDITKAFNRVIDSGWYLLGKEIEEFEENFATYCNAKYCIGVASGLDALSLTIKAYGIGNSDEIIVPSNTFIATVFSVTSCGATPVFVEPDPQTHLIDTKKIEEKITPETKAIIPVHLYGNSCEMQPILALAEKYDLKILDDSAQAHGAVCLGEENTDLIPQRSMAFSFYPGKNLGALADAGAIVTNDHELAKKIKAIRNYGSEVKYYSKYLGCNSRMDEIQAAILNIKLKGLDQDNDARRKIAEFYLQTINNNKISLPVESQNPENHVWHLFVIKTHNRDGLKNHLESKGIQTLIHYPIPPHKQQCYAEYNHLHLPIAEQLANEVLSLPISPVMTVQQAHDVAEAINQWK